MQKSVQKLWDLVIFPSVSSYLNILIKLSLFEEIEMPLQLPVQQPGLFPLLPALHRSPDHFPPPTPATTPGSPGDRKKKSLIFVYFFELHPFYWTFRIIPALAILYIHEEEQNEISMYDFTVIIPDNLRFVIDCRGSVLDFIANCPSCVFSLKSYPNNRECSYLQ